MTGPMMKVVEVAEANAPFRVVERPIPDPRPGEVRIRVEACGICHSDMYAKTGTFPGIAYPRIPGHEVAGVIDALGAGVTGWRPGQRVGVGWLAGSCGRCVACRRGGASQHRHSTGTGHRRDDVRADGWRNGAGRGNACLSSHRSEWRLQARRRARGRGLLLALSETLAHDKAAALVEQLLRAEPDDRDLWLYRARIALTADERALALASMTRKPS